MNTNTNTQKSSTLSVQKLTMGAILTALVIVLQLIGSSIHLGPFSISLVLIPIVIGAATCGVTVGAWLGLVFGVTVLLSGDAALFLAVNVPGTVVTVLLKGILCGLAAALVYRALSSWNQTAAVIVAAIVCPVVNTGTFLLGCRLFFFDTVTQWAGGGSVLQYMIVGLVGGNFLVELALNVVLGPIVVKLLSILKKTK